MKFTRTQLATKNNQYLDIKTFFKKYLQSYLRWIYEQNSEFETYLTTEEICNFFIKEVKHPLWFQLYLKTTPFRVIIETNNYFDKYKKNANKMQVDVPIVLINPINHLTPVNIDMPYKKADNIDYQNAKYLVNKYKLEMLDEITEVDATLLKQVDQLIKKGEFKNAK